MTWLAVRARPAASDRDAAIAAFFRLDCQGVMEERDEIVTHLPGSVSASQVAAAFREAGVSCALEFSEYEPVDWIEHWKHNLRGVQAGALRVCPPWLKQADEDGGRTVIIQPGMGFGTGDHQSTRCALRLLQDHVAAGQTVADLGAGSGVLSIAAVKLGAKFATGMEVDGDAVTNAQENALLNNVESSVMFLEGDAATLLLLVAPVDIIVANIESRPLLGLLGAIGAALAEQGVAILSGLLAEERSWFDERVRQEGWSIVSEDREDDWCAIAVRRA